MDHFALLHIVLCSPIIPWHLQDTKASIANLSFTCLPPSTPSPMHYSLYSPLPLFFFLLLFTISVESLEGADQEKRGQGGLALVKTINGQLLTTKPPHWGMEAKAGLMPNFGQLLVLTLLSLWVETPSGLKWECSQLGEILSICSFFSTTKQTLKINFS